MNLNPSSLHDSARSLKIFVFGEKALAFNLTPFPIPKGACLCTASNLVDENWFSTMMTNPIGTILRYSIAISVVIMFQFLCLPFVLHPSEQIIEEGPTPEWTPHTSAMPCPNASIPQELFKSQDEEDKLLLKWFKNLCGGTYIEMGALNGQIFSNSHAFNFGLNWRGVLIEPSPFHFKALVHNRPNELAIVHAAACDKPRKVHFVDGGLYHGAVSGIHEFAEESFRTKWWSQDLLANKTAIECLPLTQILQQHVGDRFFFDFFSLDVEGGEFEVLKTLDFHKYKFGIILVESGGENAIKNLIIKSLLQLNGYGYIMEDRRSLWFMNNYFHQIYERALHL